MPEYRKREIAHKLKIGDILKATPIIETIAPEATSEVQSNIEQASSQQQSQKERLKFVELGDKKILRVNIIANIIDKFVMDSNRYASITVDDASGQIRIKVFGDDVPKFQDLNQGDTVLIIGLLRTYNKELYILPEILKKIDPRYLLVRKLELEGKAPKTPVSQPGQVTEVRDQIINIIKSGEEQGGIDTEKIILDLNNISPEMINQEIKKLLEDGIIYEPRPGRVRYLG